MIFRNSYDVVIVGNITKDFFEYNSTFNVGGSSIYAGIGSAMMGLKTLIISNHSISESDLPNHDQLDIYCVNSESNTEFVWNYEKKIRKGIIKNYTKKINLNLKSKIKTKMLMIAPIFNELDLDVRNNFDYEISLLSPQGLIRHLNKKSEICLKKISLNENFHDIDLISYSEEEDDYIDKKYLFNYVKYIAVTLSEKGAKIYSDYNKSAQFNSYTPDRVLDPTGAGDIFALYLLVYYYKTKSIEFAVNIANCAASFVVENLGINGIPSIEYVTNRLNIIKHE